MIILGSNLAADKDGLAVLDAFAFTRLRSTASASRKLWAGGSRYQDGQVAGKKMTVCSGILMVWHIAGSEID
jgi:hypothetical protein